MNLFYSKFLNSLKLKKVVKIISGLNTLNIRKVYQILKSAEIAKANYIDTAANTKIVATLKNLTNLPLCVSSIDPLELYNCSIMGAEILEIGNFDIFYKSRFNLSSFDILKLAIETRRLVQNKCICVTIPHALNFYQQIVLAKKLEKLGINFLQTEGLSYSHQKNLLKNYRYDIISESVRKSALTLSSTYFLSSLVNIPVITSSKINYISSLTSILCGACGIGIKSAIYDKKTIYEMSCCIEEILYIIKLYAKMSCFVKPTLSIKNYKKNHSIQNMVKNE
uniref:Uncharacterized protein ycf23 n=1 Tax=Caloglossa monosticha TaxID=76906 RepID=A0A1Z1M4Q9_9FLOR|nr:hypothetical protein [Caloglossa monosticha]ARW60996.1 hypothetical protein [Caloglossa monosticha]